jgi:hypothetical protein
MNTILTYLRTLNHPNIVNRAIVNKTKLVSHQSYRNSTLMYVLSDGCISCLMTFKDGTRSYGFDLYEHTYDFTRGEAHNPYNLYRKNPPLKSVVVIFDLEYTNIEETLFQQSLVHDLGQFGIKEAEMLVRLRNTYFGEKS